ncbi:MAG: hypothetical protein EPO20_30720 [Betaproteobacteria bacterium]|nr:MAG: hypothetical protein EPO20_30720 [Betaproteobacteria bacterium]
MLVIVGGVCAALFAFAFVAAPHSCEWGLTAYFWSGVASLLILFATPFALRTDRTTLVRVGFGFGFAVLGAAIWFAGLVAANVRIMCRLF